MIDLADLLDGPWRGLVWTVIGVACTAILLALLSRLDNRSSATLRLDWFLPALRRLKSGQSLNVRWSGKILRTAIPSRMLSDRRTKKRGAFRNGLRRLGISWSASPVRRCVQALCLVLFIVSFLYVCWPYTAQPAAPPQVAASWAFDDLDQQTGAFIFRGGQIQPWLAESQRVHVRSQGASSSTPMSIGSLRENTIELVPTDETADDSLDAILTGQATWQLVDRDPEAWPSHYADDLARKEVIPAELFLALDPLVSLSTALAARSWVWSLVCALAILVVCVLIPRGFCGYLCPLGTTIDLFDWAIGSRTNRFRVPADGWWVHIKYYLLAGVLVAATFGILVSGVVSAIPVITRAMLFIVEPLQSGTMRGWHLVPGFGVGQAVSIGLFLAILFLGFLRPRFWCKYVCPSGALFSLGNLLRATERKVESSCIHCNKCVEICPFDAIKPDFTTRETDCTMCQSCGGVCPTHAIKFVERWNTVELKVDNDPPTGETAIGRRGFLSLAAGSTAAIGGGIGVAAAIKHAGASQVGAVLPVRPPGSVPEPEFLQMCIRCGECFKACPNNVLQPEAFEQGLEGLWAPMVNADWAGCESSCNACGQVCPTGAIRALPLEEKRVARMGLAIVNDQTCLPMAGREDCDLCVQECDAAGYHAIEYIQVGTQADENGVPIEGTGMLAPVVLDEKCVGCGLCQTRCYGINVKERGVLSHSAIVVEAGPGKEDRIMSGSYIEMRQSETRSTRPRVEFELPTVPATSPDPSPTTSSDSEVGPIEDSDNPFGL